MRINASELSVVTQHFWQYSTLREDSATAFWKVLKQKSALHLCELKIRASALCAQPPSFSQQTLSLLGTEQVETALAGVRAACTEAQCPMKRDGKGSVTLWGTSRWVWLDVVKKQNCWGQDGVALLQQWLKNFPAVRLVSDPGLAWGGLSLCREERKLTAENTKMWREKQCLQRDICS